MNVFVPESLKILRNWCTWKLEQSNGRITKMPYQVNGRRASSVHRSTWNTLDAIMELLSIDDSYLGLGFMVSADDDIIFIDVDHCIDDDGNMDERGASVLDAFPQSYAEISVSGQGLHILTRGILPRSFHNQKKGVEAYSSARFCAFTGDAIQRNEPTTEQEGIDFVFNKFGSRARKANSFNTADAISTHSDKWVLAHACDIRGKQGRDFKTLFFDGDTFAYPSKSEADEALCVLLSFWCDRDPVQIDRLFRQSALYRSKWEREDYRIRTITHACEHIPESISEYQKRMNREKARAIAEER